MHCEPVCHQWWVGVLWLDDNKESSFLPVISKTFPYFYKLFCFSVHVTVHHYVYCRFRHFVLLFEHLIIIMWYCLYLCINYHDCHCQVEAEAELRGWQGFQGWARIRSHAGKPIIPGNSRARSCAGEEDRITWLDLRPCLVLSCIIFDRPPRGVSRRSGRARIKAQWGWGYKGAWLITHILLK